MRAAGMHGCTWHGQAPIAEVRTKRPFECSLVPDPETASVMRSSERL